jgi:hypothetical protein
MSTDKAKKAPQPLTSRLAAWLPNVFVLGLLPLVMAVSVWLLQALVDSYVTTILRPAGPSLIYLPNLINYLDQTGLVAVFGLCLVVVYVLIVRKRSPGIILLGGAVTAFLVFMSVALVIPSYAFSLTHPLNQVLQTLPTEDHVYQLVDRAECHHGCSHSYVVLECDPSSWMCHNYGTSSQRVMQPQPCDQPIPVVSLAHNPATHQLEMTVDGDTRELNPADDIIFYGYSWDRCGLGGLKR